MWGKAWNKGTKTGKGGKSIAKGADRSQEMWTGATWNQGGKGTWASASAAPERYAGSGSYDYDAYAAAPAAGKGWEGSASGKGKEQTSGKGKEWVARLEGKYALAKTVLRPYADERGQAVYAQGSVLDFFDKHHMRQIIDSRNSELARRPAIGMSVVSSSMLALTGLFEEEETEEDRKFHGALQNLRSLFAGEDGAAFKKACEILSKDRMQALEACTLANALGNWSSKVPTTVANEASLSRWQSSPKTLKLLIDYLVEAFGQRQTDDAAWKRTYGGWGGDSDEELDDSGAGGLAWGIRAPEDGRHARKSKISSSSSSKRHRKAAKREEKRKHKKEARSTDENQPTKLLAKTKANEGDEEKTTAKVKAHKKLEAKDKKSSETSASSSSRRRRKAAKRAERREEKRQLRKVAKAAHKDGEREIAETSEVGDDERLVLGVDDAAVASEAILFRQRRVEKHKLETGCVVCILAASRQEMDAQMTNENP
ncbi:unnamed protein product [Symbiodinium necroappetens]|uniref:Uncharacterized protein n=1 Tax=Symbiodinium necroappetens TaxID=1628268 RepID=A0A813BCQ4_9DINO|nr:unnamed protein product [Symbiodinium necroappetens]